MSTAVERRAAARRLFEDTGAEAAWIAGALGIAEASLHQLALREGWRRREAAIAETVDRLLAQLSAQLALFERQAEEAEGLSKAQLDALLAITRTFDRLGEMKRAEEARRSAEPDAREIDRARHAVERRVGELSEQRAVSIIAASAADRPNDTQD